jgi:hypothetical protein
MRGEIAVYSRLQSPSERADVKLIERNRNLSVKACLRQ